MCLLIKATVKTLIKYLRFYLSCIYIDTYTKHDEQLIKKHTFNQRFIRRRITTYTNT